ncbi:Hint domain-containing protein [Rhodobacter sp. Har01]|uniref:Hint domain-containing protein n=1 Tax=Rhodobacter sp. Har01 TaxID=2883999 RepID=UPI001D08DAC8|nr:Hint domain-containing protein [Rhodobacter sp. Har01]MCB6176960.1 Hint domain-containing protein [Rhodobacter sp. Har01]
MGKRSICQIADRATPLRPAAGIAAGTPVLTLDGELPVQFLVPGDRVVTRSGARVLCGIGVATFRDADLLRVNAAALGAAFDKPSHHHIACSQPLRLHDWRARALFGREVAVVAAERLADGEYMHREQVSEACLFTLHFEQPEIIYAGGQELACAPAPAAA